MHPIINLLQFNASKLNDLSLDEGVSIDPISPFTKFLSSSNPSRKHLFGGSDNPVKIIE